MWNCCRSRKKCFLLILAATSWFHVFSLLIDKKSQCNHVQWIRNEMFLYEFANNVQWEEREQISMFFTHFKDSIVKMWHNNLIFFHLLLFYFFLRRENLLAKMTEANNGSESFTVWSIWWMSPPRVPHFL